MNRSERAPPDFLLDNILVYAMLCTAIIVAGSIFRSSVEGFLSRSAVKVLQDWSQIALSLDAEWNGRVDDGAKDCCMQASTCVLIIRRLNLFGSIIELIHMFNCCRSVCRTMRAVLDGNPMGRDKTSTLFPLSSGLYTRSSRDWCR